MEKKFRKLALLRLSPFELERLDFSFKKLLKLDVPKEFRKFYQEYKQIFNFSEKSYFTESVDEDIELKIAEIRERIKNIAKAISLGIDSDFPELVKIEETEKYGFHLTTTKRTMGVV